ncbi:hypothetical protein [Luteococcus sp.]|uniref:hypothetical protein n=1 Tax=Luteococcus sp. TaxID=1969402 RepID=UPI003734EC5E
MTDIHRRLGVAALCGLTLVLGGCNDSSDPEPEPTASLQQPAGGATSEGSVRYQDEDDDATPDADDSDDATPDADDDADDDGTPDADDDDDDDDGTPDTDDKDDKDDDR